MEIKQNEWNHLRVIVHDATGQHLAQDALERLYWSMPRELREEGITLGMADANWQLEVTQHLRARMFGLKSGQAYRAEKERTKEERTKHYLLIACFVVSTVAMIEAVRRLLNNDDSYLYFAVTGVAVGVVMKVFKL